MPDYNTFRLSGLMCTFLQGSQWFTFQLSTTDLTRLLTNQPTYAIIAHVCKTWQIFIRQRCHRAFAAARGQSWPHKDGRL